MSYLIVGAICLLLGAVFGVLWGRKHPAQANAIADAANQAKKL